MGGGEGGEGEEVGGWREMQLCTTRKRCTKVLDVPFHTQRHLFIEEEKGEKEMKRWRFRILWNYLVSNELNFEKGEKIEKINKMEPPNGLNDTMEHYSTKFN